MKQIVILSGKGGTGKTTLASSFAALAAGEIKIVLADLDVDASNMELLLQPQIVDSGEFISGKIAAIDQDLCSRCGLCLDACRFDAVVKQNGRFLIDESFCEGCLACYHQCPAGAIQIQEQITGDWFASATRYGDLFHARLLPGAENSGKLVSHIRSAAAERCQMEDCGLLLMDGPPGTGCPVTASLNHADFTVIVTEPTKSGFHDLARIARVAAHFRVPAFLVINKSDLNLEVRQEIIDFARRNRLPLIGEIPYDERIPTLQSLAKPLVEADDGLAVGEIRIVWERLKLETGLNNGRE